MHCYLFAGGWYKYGVSAHIFTAACECILDRAATQFDVSCAGALEWYYHLYASVLLLLGSSDVSYRGCVLTCLQMQKKIGTAVAKIERGTRMAEQFMQSVHAINLAPQEIKCTHPGHSFKECLHLCVFQL